MFSAAAARVLPPRADLPKQHGPCTVCTGMKTIGNPPSDSVRLVRIIRPLAAGSASFGGWGPRVPGL
jgi:hypothetical protein